MKKTHKELLECLRFLNETNSIAQTAEEFGLSKQTLYNLFYCDKPEKVWKFKPKYLRKWYEYYAGYKGLLIMIQHHEEFKCSLPTLLYLQELEKKIEEFNGLEISVL